MLSVFRQELRQRQFSQRGLVFGKFWNLRGWRRNVFAQQATHDPVPALDGTRPQAGCVPGQKNGHRQQAATSKLSSLFDADPFVAASFGDRQVVMSGENWIDERVIGIQKREHRTIVLRDVDKESKRLFVHRLSQFVVEFGETLAVDSVVLFEPPHVEPVATEFHGQPANAVVAQHPLGLGCEHFGTGQIARRRMRQQLVIGHTRPQKITQAAGQFVGR